MRQLLHTLTLLTLLISCTRPTETANEQTNDSVTQTSMTSDSVRIENVNDSILPDFAKDVNLPVNILIDKSKIIFGDFNADQNEDFASVVKNLDNGFHGVLIVHNNDKLEYFLFGAGNEINGMKDLDWIDIFEIIPKGKIIAPTLVDTETGDIIGPDESQQFRLLGNGIFMHIEEASGGGILYWTGEKYEWCHIE